MVQRTGSSSYLEGVPPGLAQVLPSRTDGCYLWAPFGQFGRDGCRKGASGAMFASPFEVRPPDGVQFRPVVNEIKHFSPSRT